MHPHRGAAGLSAMQCDCLQAEILSDNEPSINWLRKLGYTPHSATFYVYESGESDHLIVFRKALKILHAYS